MSQTRHQRRFTISEVAAGWHELKLPQHTLPALTGSWIRGTGSRHTNALVVSSISYSLTGSQLSLPHGINTKYETKNKIISVKCSVQSDYRDAYDMRYHNVAGVHTCVL